MDGDFPVVLPNGGAFLDGFMRRRGFVSQQETGQPAQTLSFESQQMLGGPEIGQIAMSEQPDMVREIPQSMVAPVTERVFPGYLQRRDELLRRLGRLKQV
jgi:hypothetical protein|tara:strand:+ start:304 stop:603 length:300 start_codon:yes stop_codon:yes gene_type:complete